MHRFRQKFHANQSGATAIEYALICALIVLAMVAGITALGGSNASGWAGVSTKVSAAL